MMPPTPSGEALMAAQQVLAPDQIGFDVRIHLTTGLVQSALEAAYRRDFPRSRPPTDEESPTERELKAAHDMRMALMALRVEVPGEIVDDLLRRLNELRAARYPTDFGVNLDYVPYEDEHAALRSRPAPTRSPHWPYEKHVEGDFHRAVVRNVTCGGQLRYRVLNDIHDDREYRCDKCGKKWIEEGADS